MGSAFIANVLYPLFLGRLVLSAKPTFGSDIFGIFVVAVIAVSADLAEIHRHRAVANVCANLTAGVHAALAYPAMPDLGTRGHGSHALQTGNLIFRGF
jgi:hypothetical protein